MLYPHEVIEYMISALIILVFLSSAILLYSINKKKIGLYITLFIFISTICFFSLRPVWVDRQIEKKSTIIEHYLQEKYPESEWAISAQNFRENKTVNPYYLLVHFKDDPNNTYYYYVDRRGKVKQMGGKFENDFLLESKYGEVE